MGKQRRLYSCIAERRQRDRNGRDFNGAQRGAPVAVHARRRAAARRARHRRHFVAAHRHHVPGVPLPAGMTNPNPWPYVNLGPAVITHAMDSCHLVMFLDEDPPRT